MVTTLPIIQIDDSKDNPLRRVSYPVLSEEFGSEPLIKLIKDMRITLALEEDGVALAAPQVGINKQLFVVSPLSYKDDSKFRPLVFINPRILKTNKKRVEMEEGCLSVRWIYGKTRRYTTVSIEALDENGKLFTYGASGLLAHIFQHEIDHLYGELFIDRGYDLEEFSEEEVKESTKKDGFFSLH